MNARVASRASAERTPRRADPGRSRLARRSTGSGPSNLASSTPLGADLLYDLAYWGFTASGQPFCCLGEQATTTPAGIDIFGASTTDSVDVGAAGEFSFTDSEAAHIAFVGGFGVDSAVVDCADEGKVWLSGGSFSDDLRVGPRCWGLVQGDANVDHLIAETQPLPSADPTRKMVLNGGGGSDVLEAPWPDRLPTEPAPPLELWGGGAGNTLCTDHGGVMMRGSSPAAGANALFIASGFSNAVPYTIHPSTSAVTASSTCGAPNHNAALPGWAGPTCSYAGGITRPPFCGHVGD